MALIRGSKDDKLKFIKEQLEIGIKENLLLEYVNGIINMINHEIKRKKC